METATEEGDPSKQTSSHTSQKTPLFTGNVLLFYAFDVGGDIDLNRIEREGLVPTHSAPLSPYFKNYHVALSFLLKQDDHNGSTRNRSDFISGKIHHFGVVSFCYRIPFEDTLENLKISLIETKNKYDHKSEIDAGSVFKSIFPTIDEPNFYNLKNFYFAIHINPGAKKMPPLEFKEKHGSKIASLLRLETKNLSPQQKEKILESSTGYYGKDLIIIDSEAACIFDDEYYEAMEFLESANVQKLELKYFDKKLDEELNAFYKKSYKTPIRSYIPLLASRTERPISRLASLRVDISVVTERLENSIKMTGDAYYEHLYTMLIKKLSINSWKESIDKKLDIIWDIYTVHQNRLDALHEEILTVVIILLIAFEAFVAFFK